MDVLNLLIKTDKTVTISEVELKLTKLFKNMGNLKAMVIAAPSKLISVFNQFIPIHLKKLMIIYLSDFSSRWMDLINNINTYYSQTTLGALKAYVHVFANWNNIFSESDWTATVCCEMVKIKVAQSYVNLDERLKRMQISSGTQTNVTVALRELVNLLKNNGTSSVFGGFGKGIKNKSGKKSDPKSVSFGKGGKFKSDNKSGIKGGVKHTSFGLTKSLFTKNVTPKPDNMIWDLYNFISDNHLQLDYQGIANSSICQWYNCQICTFGDHRCKFDHACIACGGSHPIIHCNYLK